MQTALVLQITLYPQLVRMQGYSPHCEAKPQQTRVPEESSMQCMEIWSKLAKMYILLRTKYAMQPCMQYSCTQYVEPGIETHTSNCKNTVSYAKLQFNIKNADCSAIP